MSVFVLIGASWIYTTWLKPQRKTLLQATGWHSWSFIWGATLSGSSPDASWTLTNTAWSPLQHLSSSNGIFHLLLYSHRFSNITDDTYLLRTFHHTWILQQTSSFLAVEVEVMTIRKATSVSFLYYFGCWLRLRLWRFAKLPLYFISYFHITLLHTSQHYLDASIANPSWQSIPNWFGHASVSCALRFWFLPTSTYYQSTYKRTLQFFSSQYCHIAKTGRRCSINSTGFPYRIVWIPDASHRTVTAHANQ